MAFKSSEDDHRSHPTPFLMPSLASAALKAVNFASPSLASAALEAVNFASKPKK
jgi:hypothetical protein